MSRHYRQTSSVLSPKPPKSVDFPGNIRSRVKASVKIWTILLILLTVRAMLDGSHFHINFILVRPVSSPAAGCQIIESQSVFGVEQR
ncbi:hypothetical protein RRG08_007544 [Elysia crispata]|uniref:Uncharacterized protein n=1 Tax=Elysia crispata TaxID=231223 RepID=A0AAE0YFX4_9GAST|nr:hypothetical protein RRG08_007544 [Elysia crispata]